MSYVDHKIRMLYKIPWDKLPENIRVILNEQLEHLKKIKEVKSKIFNMQSLAEDADDVTANAMREIIENLRSSIADDESYELRYIITKRSHELVLHKKQTKIEPGKSLLKKNNFSKINISKVCNDWLLWENDDEDL